MRRWMVAVGALLLAPGTRAASAQTAAPTQTIDSIVVLNEDVFAREEEDLTFLAKLANALHIRTRAATIRRTLLLNQGDPFDSARIVESERALRSLAVFRQVALDTAWVRNRLYLLVVTGDGWSTRPHLNFSSAAGDESWSIGITEENFLGTATEVGLGYYKSVDRSAFELAYRNPHFIARRALLLLRYADLSDGTRASWRLGIPFAQTAARGALETSGAIGEGRVLVFKANDRDTTYLDTTYQHRSARFTLRGGVALSATSRSYVRAWLAATVRRQDYGAENAVTLPHSVFGTVGAGVDFGRPRYHILRRFNSYARREDVDLSHAARVALWVAPSAWGYPAGRAGLGPELSFQTSAVWSGGFTVLRGWGHGIFGSAGLDSGRVAMSVTLGSQNFPGQSLVVHGQVAAAHKPAPGDAYDFWYDRSGPRLFGAHAFTGTRLVWFTVEDRIVIDDDFYGLMGIGLAPFFDWGGVWFMDEEPRTGGNVGLALRLGPTRATQGDPAEISFGARFGAGVTNRNRWALTIRRALRF